MHGTLSESHWAAPGASWEKSAFRAFCLLSEQQRLASGDHRQGGTPLSDAKALFRLGSSQSQSLRKRAAQDSRPHFAVLHLVSGF